MKKFKSKLIPEDDIKLGKKGPPCDPRALSIEPLTEHPMGERIVQWAERAYAEVQAKTVGRGTGVKLFSQREDQVRSKRVEVFLDTLFFEVKPAVSTRPAKIRRHADAPSRIHKFLEENGMFDAELRGFLEELAGKALTVMSMPITRPFYWSVLRVDPRAPPQTPHYDQKDDSEYWSIIIPLTNHPHQGYTMFPESPVVAFPGSSYAFNGDTWHFGTANKSEYVRYALMGVTHAEGSEDANRVNACPVCLVRP